MDEGATYQPFCLGGWARSVPLPFVAAPEGHCVPPSLSGGTIVPVTLLSPVSISPHKLVCALVVKKIQMIVLAADI